MAIKQTGGAALRARRKRMEGATLWRDICPDLSCVPSRLRFRVSRWRTGTDPSLTEDFDELIATLPADRAALLIEAILDSYETHHGGELPHVLDAMEAEQKADGAEDEIQIRAMRDPTVWDIWAERSLEHAARARQARVAIRRERLGLQRQKVA